MRLKKPKYPNYLSQEASPDLQVAPSLLGSGDPPGDPHRGREGLSRAQCERCTLHER